MKERFRRFCRHLWTTVEESSAVMYGVEIDVTDDGDMKHIPSPFVHVHKVTHTTQRKIAR